jgi:hypothetical protein
MQVTFLSGSWFPQVKFNVVEGRGVAHSLIGTLNEYPPSSLSYASLPDSHPDSGEKKSISPLCGLCPSCRSLSLSCVSLGISSASLSVPVAFHRQVPLWEASQVTRRAKACSVAPKTRPTGASLLFSLQMPILIKPSTFFSWNHQLTS